MERSSEKHPDETVTLTFDYSNELDPGVELTNPVTLTVEVDVSSPVSDVAPENTKSGTPQVERLMVLHRMIGGLDKVDYLWTCRAATTAGDVLVRELLVPVRARLQP